MKLQEHIRGKLHDGLVNIVYKTLKARQQTERQTNKCFFFLFKASTQC